MGWDTSPCRASWSVRRPRVPKGLPEGEVENQRTKWWIPSGYVKIAIENHRNSGTSILMRGSYREPYAENCGKTSRCSSKFHEFPVLQGLLGLSDCLVFEDCLKAMVSKPYKLNEMNDRGLNLQIEVKLVVFPLWTCSGFIADCFFLACGYATVLQHNTCADPCGPMFEQQDSVDSKNTMVTSKPFIHHLSTSKLTLPWNITILHGKTHYFNGHCQ